MMESAKKWRRDNATNGVYCSRHRGVVNTENSNPDVMMVKPAEDQV
jgi:hypothetical protein